MTTDAPQSVLSHLQELRWRIVKMLLAVAVGSGIALVFATGIKALLQAPYDAACATCQLQVFGATEEFSVLMRIALFGGLVIASPAVLYQIWAFIAPALTDKEKKWAIPIVGSSAALFTVGVVFGYWTLPRGLGFLLNIFPDVRTDLRMLDYFNFVTRYLLAFGVAFLYPVFLFTAAAIGVITAEQLSKGRRWAIMIIVVGAAIITPTGDALTLTLLSVPLYILYEATYWLVRLVLRR